VVWICWRLEGVLVRVKSLWNRLTLAQRFAVACFTVLVAGMLVIGWWVSAEIEAGVTRNSAVTTALYMNSFIAPEVAELEFRETLSPESIAALDRLHKETPLGKGIVSSKIWGPGSRILYSSRPSIIGQVFPETPSLRAAFEGHVTAEFSNLEDEEDSLERGHGHRLLEIYSPVRAKGSDRVIAVAEFYEHAHELEARLLRARVSSWIVVAAVTSIMFWLLFGIVRGGSQTISRQQRELRSRVGDLSALLKQNDELSERVRRATNRATEINERFLRRVSAELHDGPAQALGFALLRLDSVKQYIGGCEYADHVEGCPYAGKMSDGHNVDSIRSSLNEALQEIRNLSSGLALPELGDLTLKQCLQRVVRSHERRTGSQVDMDVDGLPSEMSLPVKISVYRFVQEALHNAYNHGGGKGQRLTVAKTDDAALNVTVSDEGSGFDPSQKLETPVHLGLVGMRERIESLGGDFELRSTPGQGTRVSARLPLRNLQ
jgi:signal transduction histidine kinase